MVNIVRPLLLHASVTNKALIDKPFSINAFTCKKKKKKTIEMS